MALRQVADPCGAPLGGSVDMTLIAAGLVNPYPQASHGVIPDAITTTKGRSSAKRQLFDGPLKPDSRQERYNNGEQR